MVTDNFTRALTFTLGQEGGYSDHACDKGGRTMMGITSKTLARAHKAGLTDCQDANDVTHYDVPLETMQAVLVEMLGAYSQCHSHKQELRAQITAAEDEAALDAVIIAWPI